MGKAAKPDQFHLLVYQGLNCGRIIIDRNKLNLHANLALEILGDRPELTDLLCCCLFGNGGHA